MHQMALKEEFERNENVYKHVEMQEAEERRLRDDELERMRLQWLEQMRVILILVPLLFTCNRGGNANRRQLSATPAAFSSSILV